MTVQESQKVIGEVVKKKEHAEEGIGIDSCEVKKSWMQKIDATVMEEHSESSEDKSVEEISISKEECETNTEILLEERIDRGLKLRRKEHAQYDEENSHESGNESSVDLEEITDITLS